MREGQSPDVSDGESLSVDCSQFKSSLVASLDVQRASRSEREKPCEIAPSSSCMSASLFVKSARMGLFPANKYGTYCHFLRQYSSREHPKASLLQRDPGDIVVRLSPVTPLSHLTK